MSVVTQSRWTCDFCGRAATERPEGWARTRSWGYSGKQDGPEIHCCDGPSCVQAMKDACFHRGLVPPAGMTFDHITGR